MVIPEPWALVFRALGVPADAVIAVPNFGLDLYRLVSSDDPGPEDFEPVPAWVARKRGIPELLRQGLSHFLTAEQADAVRTKAGSHVARVVLHRDPRIFIARTDRDRPGHVEVWLPPDLIEHVLSTIEIVIWASIVG